MRKTTTVLGALAALILGTAAYAQDPQPQAPAAGQPQPPAASGGSQAPAQAQTPTIKSISIVDVSELPADTQKQVNDVVAKGGETNLKSLRDSIDATPQVADALKAKGLTSRQVILASMDPGGTLTLITKKSS